MTVRYHEKVDITDLQNYHNDNIYLSYIEIDDINSHAEQLVTDIQNTSWISKLDPIPQASYTVTAHNSIQKLVQIFKSVDNKVTKDFGEFLVSMSSGYCLRDKESHQVLPLSEIWKSKLSNNDGFDFHTITPDDYISFGEAKYVTTGNSYTTSAEQAFRFFGESKDQADAVHLMHLCSPSSVEKLIKKERCCIVAFSLNSEDYKTILHNSLENKDIISLSKECHELFIIGVKA